MAARGRERGGSLGNIEDLFKRKRAEGEEGKEMGKKEDIFKKSNITARSPRKEKIEGGKMRMENNGEEGGWKEILLGWRGEMMKEMMKEIRGMKDWKEDIRAMKEEVKEGIREQGKMLRDEVEKVRRELREQEERWMKEREELRRRIQELEKGMEGREENRLERAVGSGGK